MGRDLRRLTQGGGQVGDRPNDLQVRLRLEERAESLAHQAIIVDDQHPNPLGHESLRVRRTIRKGREA
jgi:hypothetical protein